MILMVDLKQPLCNKDSPSPFKSQVFNQKKKDSRISTPSTYYILHGYQAIDKFNILILYRFSSSETIFCIRSVEHPFSLISFWKGYYRCHVFNLRSYYDFDTWEKNTNHIYRERKLDCSFKRKEYIMRWASNTSIQKRFWSNRKVLMKFCARLLSNNIFLLDWLK